LSMPVRVEGHHCGWLPALQRVGHTRQRRLRAAMAIVNLKFTARVDPESGSTLRLL
jgi:hypothetical protein